jgi:hypothetical protein
VDLVRYYDYSSSFFSDSFHFISLHFISFHFYYPYHRYQHTKSFLRFFDRPSRVTGESEFLVEGNPKLFCCSGSSDGMVFYLPLLDEQGKRIKVSLQYITNLSGIPAGHKDRSIIRKCGSFTLVALGRTGCEEIV